MKRRNFVKLSGVGVASAAVQVPSPALPRYSIVTKHRPALGGLGMPGPYPGQVVQIRAKSSIDEKTDTIDRAVVEQMLDRGICALTGENKRADAWRRFFDPSDFVGIKVNCVGRPKVVSSPEVVSEIVRNLVAVGVRPDRICIYERFSEHLDEVNYVPHLPAGVRIFGAETLRGSNSAYDPFTYVDVDFFGEDDTRSNLIRMVSETFTKIINVPNVKDHGAAGATGCLKNIAYGSFSNVARSHASSKTNTLSFIGTLASVEPLRSRTVLQVVDGIRGVWHGGPFGNVPRYVYYPKQILMGTDPVALDRTIVDLVEEKRRAEGVISIWDRSAESLKNGKNRFQDPNANAFIREPGHVEYASKLGLGIANPKRMKLRSIVL